MRVLQNFTPASGRITSLAARIFYLAAAFLMVLSAARGAACAQDKITIAAAADLTYALKEIAAGFEKDSGVNVTVSYGSTGMFDAQIRHGAPFDVFMAADANTVEALKRDGLVLPDTVKIYALGWIVLVANKNSGAAIKDLKGLLDTSIKRVAIANPAHAPYGRAAQEALMSAGLWDEMKGKLVYGENIRQALQYVQTGNAQAGIVAKSVSNTPEVSAIEIDKTLYKPLTQAVAVVRSTKKEGRAREFIKYLTGPQGSNVLKKYGFSLPDGR